MNPVCDDREEQRPGLFSKLDRREQRARTFNHQGGFPRCVTVREARRTVSGVRHDPEAFNAILLTTTYKARNHKRFVESRLSCL